MINIKEALSKLDRAGLLAELVEGSEPRTIGRISKSEELGLSVYQNSFAIYRQDGSVVDVLII